MSDRLSFGISGSLYVWFQETGRVDCRDAVSIITDEAEYGGLALSGPFIKIMGTRFATLPRLSTVSVTHTLPAFANRPTQFMRGKIFFFRRKSCDVINHFVALAYMLLSERVMEIIHRFNTEVQQ